MSLPDIFDSSKSHRCPIGHSNPLVCPCSTCKMAREAESSRLALRRAEAKNFATSGALMPPTQTIKEEVVPRETPREKIERKEREKNWQEIQASEDRYAAHRAKVLAERKKAAIILKSDLLNQSKNLNQLADGKFNALKNGSRDKAEIEKIQEALIALGFDLGKSGADGDFGSRTEKAVKQFQDVYEPTHTTHEKYQLGDNPDGIVGKNTILALDEAVNENWKYIGSQIGCDPKEFFHSKILVHEGGFVDHPSDPGGATNKGVIIATWNKYAKTLFGITPSVESLKEMTDEQAYEIFLEGYWKKSLADKINNCPIAFQFVDFYYNAPQGSAVVLQRTINALGGEVVEDWNMGPSSLNALNEIIKEGKEEEFYTTFRNKRVEYYNHRADTVKGASAFRNGWVSRAESFKDY